MQHEDAIRIAVIWSADTAASDAWLAQRDAAPARTERVGPLTLAVWGSAAVAADGRIWGGFDGILYNDELIAAQWRSRGWDVRHATHAQLVLAQVGSLGSGGLQSLRWHGVMAAWHPGMRAVMIARDPQGVGWLGAHRQGGMLVLATDPRWLPQGQAVAAGVAMRFAADGPSAHVRGERLRMQDDCAPFLRTLPDATATLAEDAADAEARQRWQSARAAVERATGGGPRRMWAAMGWQAVLGQADADAAAVGPRWSDVADPGPAEPVAHADPADRSTRLWRAHWLADVGLRQAQAEALASGCNLAVPWLEPGLLAWLEALPRPVRVAVVSRLAAADTTLDLTADENPS